MDQIEFADGFDRPDTLAFGLGAGQLAVVMVGALAAYSLVRSPLPPAVVAPIAVAIALAAAGLGWLRVAGRPALDWAVFAGLFWMRPRQGTTRWELATATSSEGSADADDGNQSQVLELFGKRRKSSSTPPGDRRKSDPDVAPTTLVERAVRVRRRHRTVHAAILERATQVRQHRPRRRPTQTG
jgi:hypothetical protein